MRGGDPSLETVRVKFQLQSDKEAPWSRAQKAYLYYLGMTHGRAEDKYDIFDHQLAVPHRLHEIRELIGAGRPWRV